MPSTIPCYFLCLLLRHDLRSLQRRHQPQPAGVCELRRLIDGCRGVVWDGVGGVGKVGLLNDVL